MNKLSLIAVAIIAAAPPAWAAQNCSPIGSTTQTGGCTNAVGGSIRQTNPHCKTYSYTCWGAPDGTGTKVENCNTCVTGYKTNTVKKSDTYCNSVSQIICVQDTGGTTTPPTTKCDMAECAADNNNWVAHQTGSQQQIIRTCVGNTCTVMQTNYRCVAGYYGTPSATVKCSRCPQLPGSTTYGLSSMGATKITECYWPSGGGGSDSSGSFIFTSHCYYVQ